jgi:hypothetical protein
MEEWLERWSCLLATLDRGCEGSRSFSNEALVKLIIIHCVTVGFLYEIFITAM